MSRRRNKDRGLPRRVAIKDGAYRFRPVDRMIDPADGVAKTWIKLCAVSEGESVMYAALSKLLDDKTLSKESMSFLCAEFKKYKLGKYGKDTRDQYTGFLNKIAIGFSDFFVVQVTTKDCADFIRNNFRDTPNTAKKYAALMGKLFVYAISELGVRPDNPIDQIDLGSYETSRREVLATHAQIAAIRSAGFIAADGKKTPSGEMFACFIDISYLCWQRAIDVRYLKESQIDGDYIRFKPSKTQKTSGKQVDIFITPDIKDVLDRARAIKKRYKIISEYVFCKDDCKPYARTGLYSMWDRAKARAGITADVTFRDIRALGATDAAKKGEARADIQKRLAHTSAKTTEIYIKEVIADRSTMKSKLPW